MANDKKEAQDSEPEEIVPEDIAKERRDFLKKAAATVAAAPLATLLLSAKATPAQAALSGMGDPDGDDAD